MHPADGSSTRGGSTSVRGRVRSLHVWLPAVAKLQAASVSIAQGSCAMGQTNGSRYRLMPPYGGGIILIRALPLELYRERELWT